jgi:3'-5' exoribonuclease
MTVTELKRSLCDGAGGVEALIHGQLAQARPDETSNRKPYYRLRMVDASDGLDVNVWSDTPAFTFIQSHIVREGSYIELQGVFSKTERGLNTQGLSIRVLTAEEKMTLLNGSAERCAELDRWEADLDAAIQTMSDPLLKTLSEKVFDKVRVRFKRAAAAQKVHHARRGGLIEHTASMVRLANAMAGCYPDANIDLIVFGVMWHDLGKCFECDVEDGFAVQASLTGALVGHIALGTLIVSTTLLEIIQADKALLTGRSFEEIRAHILHVILAHHGTNEHGSPVEPQTLEALIVHTIDTLDAHAEIMRAAWLAAEPNAHLIDAPRPLKGKLARSLRRISSYGE